MDEKNIVSIEDRIPKLKQARKKKANRRLVFYLSIFFLLISVIVYLQSPLSNVKTIAVTGNTLVSEKEVKKVSNITSETNIWTIKKGKVEEALHKNPIIQSAKVSRKFPRTVKIHVTEHQRVGYLKQDDSFYPITGDGEILSASEQESISGEAPLLIDFSEKSLRKMTAELNKLPKGLLNMISEIHWKPTDDNKYKIMLYMNDGFLVDGTIREFADKMKIYPSIVRQLETDDKGIVHIGVGAYFEPFEEDEEKSDEDEE